MLSNTVVILTTISISIRFCFCCWCYNTRAILISNRNAWQRRVYVFGTTVAEVESAACVIIRSCGTTITVAAATTTVAVAVIATIAMCRRHVMVLFRSMGHCCRRRVAASFYSVRYHCACIIHVHAVLRLRLRPLIHAIVCHKLNHISPILCGMPLREMGELARGGGGGINTTMHANANLRMVERA